MWIVSMWIEYNEKVLLVHTSHPSCMHGVLVGAGGC
jgi:hypothetical protein